MSTPNTKVVPENLSHSDVVELTTPAAAAVAATAAAAHPAENKPDPKAVQILKALLDEQKPITEVSAKFNMPREELLKLCDANFSKATSSGDIKVSGMNVLKLTESQRDTFQNIYRAAEIDTRTIRTKTDELLNLISVLVENSSKAQQQLAATLVKNTKDLLEQSKKGEDLRVDIGKKAVDYLYIKMT